MMDTMVQNAPTGIDGGKAGSREAVRFTTLRGASEIADFILRQYSGKVVEVGAGFMPDVALLLKPHLTVVATDKEKHSLEGLPVTKDDIFSPRMEIYEGASLLYSIRPPIEIQMAMGRLGAEIGTDVLIRPLNDEIAELPGFSRNLINSGNAMFYIFRLNP
jgi:uncharacterized UPF0146 family protein